MTYICLALGLCLLASVSGYPHYRDLIPNGKKVPHPCKPNYVWKGVGHENQGGEGDRNQFGRDWLTNGKKWDECLCQTDSDGDGRTNGEELGDPHCKWSPGDIPETTIGLSHPGVCEPIDDKDCIAKNSWDIDCSSVEFVCDEKEDTKDVRSMTLKLDETAVPANETTYICQLLDLPTNGDFHLIASEPYIHNENVMHHLILWGCSEENITALKAEFGTPTICGMEALVCSNVLDKWTIGSTGTCLGREYGIRIGTSGYKYALLEMHWNNPERRNDYTDGSGLTLYYTPTLRQYDGSTIFVGPLYLEIPPGYSEVVNQGGCNPYCTETILSAPIKIPSITPHMHYMGRNMTVELKRNRESLGIVLEENDYNYDNPQDFLYDPPLEVQPGDEIVVTCVFDSSEQDSYVFFGEATSDEMCVAIVSYYPKQPKEAACFISDEFGFCGLDIFNNKTGACYATIEELLAEDGTLGMYWGILAAACDPTGRECFEGCPEALNQVKQHVCFQEASETAFKATLRFYDELHPFIALLVSCDERPKMNYKPAVAYTLPPDTGEVCLLSEAGIIKINSLWIMVLVAFVKIV